MWHVLFPKFKRLFSDALTKRAMFEIHGCQMNFNDTEILKGILRGCNEVGSGGLKQSIIYSFTEDPKEADVIFLITCAIRENAEQKIWNRLDHLEALRSSTNKKLIVGVLGCMAERLKEKIFSRNSIVRIICGPDSYRNMPQLLEEAFSGNLSIDTALSFEETYADVSPVRMDANSVSAYVSIMRGCNNMCSFCIVPFTRGRERSRDFHSIEKEVENLTIQGVKEIILLGQNVNSYESKVGPGVPQSHSLSPGFTTICKERDQTSFHFYDLLSHLSKKHPNIRFRFTSPHPKDFPIHLLELIKAMPNVCKNIHMPAQSGSSAVLSRMRRGYDRDSYINLIDSIRAMIPDVSISSDFIVGFCGETDEEFEETMSLMRHVKYNMAYMYAYSMREKTHAHRNYEDSVPEDVKKQRLRSLIDLFYSMSKAEVHRRVGSRQLVLIDGKSKKSAEMLCGRNDGNKTVVLTDNAYQASGALVKIGDFAEVEVLSISGTTLLGTPIKKSGITEFYHQ